MGIGRSSSRFPKCAHGKGLSPLHHHKGHLSFSTWNHRESHLCESRLGAPPQRSLLPQARASRQRGRQAPGLAQIH